MVRIGNLGASGSQVVLVAVRLLYEDDVVLRMAIFRVALAGSSWKSAALFQDTILQVGFFDGHGLAAAGSLLLPPFDVGARFAVSFCELLKDQLLVDVRFGCFW